MGLNDEWAEYVLLRAMDGYPLSPETKADLDAQGYNTDDPGKNKSKLDDQPLANKTIPTPGWWDKTGDDTATA